VARSIALQNDGKILLAGYTGSGSDTSIALARYRARDWLGSLGIA
jgi:hypothetical protein